MAGAQGQGLDGLDGVQSQLAGIAGNGYHVEADSVTANLNVWPRPLVIVINADTFESLSPAMQEVLLTAGANAIVPSLDASRSEDLLVGPAICNAAIAVVEASESDLTEMQTALEPVYAELAHDEQTAAYLDEIRAIKDELDAPPESLTCPPTDP